MKRQIVSTEEFWDKSCDYRFVRLDKHRGAIGSQVFYVTTPPEDVPGFLEGKMGEISSMLGVPRTGRLARILCCLGCHWLCERVS